ncbi:hypothetical protein L6452_30986 [Arctium lappa]|uniref:Uncharacterized protein n=1 Tax=Arctium lappa TaxID=4217 RepID=A0ACB8ZKL8_ARCLA|nr:hypothetical protein L6452_30986 [Arctium lappa]
MKARRRLSGEKRKETDSGKIEQTKTSKQVRKIVQTSDESKGKTQRKGMYYNGDFEIPKVLKTESRKYETDRYRAKKKGLPLKGKDKKKKPQKPVIGIRTQTSPMILHQTVHELNDDQRLAVESMGLGCFIDMTVDGIPSRLGYFIVNNLNTTTMELRLKHSNININEETIHHILQFPSGGLDLSEIEPDSDSKSLADAWRKQYRKEKMRPTDVMNKILETSDIDMMFKLNFLVLCEFNGRM